MNNLIDLILSSPLYQIIAAIIIIVIVFFIIKKLFKLVLVAIIIFTAFVTYVHFTGGDVNEVVKQAKDKSGELIDSAKEKLK